MNFEVHQRSFNLAVIDANSKFEVLKRFASSFPRSDISEVTRIISDMLSLKEFFVNAIKEKNELCVDSCLTNLSELSEKFDIAVFRCYNEITDREMNSSN